MKFRLLGPLGQGHNIVVYILGSPSCIAKFIGLVGKMIPMDNRTRWNSWYVMLIVLLELRTQVEMYYLIYKDKLKEDILSLKD